MIQHRGRGQYISNQRMIAHNQNNGHHISALVTCHHVLVQPHMQTGKQRPFTTRTIMASQNQGNLHYGALATCYQVRPQSGLSYN